MVNPLILILFVISGALIGWLGVVDLLPEKTIEGISNISGFKIVLAGFGTFFGALSGFFFLELRKKVIEQIRTMPTDLLISRSAGLMLGLLVANLLLAPILLLPLPKTIILIKPFIAILSNIFFGVLGYNLAEVHGRSILRLFNPNSTDALLVAEGILTPATPKILDTSVIIDGRINGLFSSGLIEGQVIVAQTVIDELQKLADSSNSEKRLKGRRGLKLLTDLRTKYTRRLVLNNTKYEGEGTDDKLLKLTSDITGTLVTADFNLAQVAKLQGLKILNLSELVIALRPDIQPGEKLNLKVVREGKEESQGVAYLDDGTMVVIEGAKPLIGKRLDIVVTGALQTPTGRMIFGNIEKDQPPKKSNKTKTSQR